MWSARLLEQSFSTYISQKCAYKKVTNRVKPVATTLLEDFHIIQNRPSDLLVDMPILPFIPPDFTPGVRYTQERYEAQNIDPDNFLWLKEAKLAHHLIKLQELAFA